MKNPSLLNSSFKIGCFCKGLIDDMSVYGWPVSRTIYLNNFYGIYSLNKCSYLSNSENHISISCLVIEWHHLKENIFLFSDFEEINTFNLNVKYIYKINYFLKTDEIKKYIFLKIMP